MSLTGCFAGAQAAAMLSLNLSDTGIVVDNVIALEEQLVKFTALEHLDLSNNEGLSGTGVVKILSFFAGM
jgi:Ran GTPase-activating protein (RanGAP) involved in mRNA processing and transport